jgi:multiple sugar transport system permease protein
MATVAQEERIRPQPRRPRRALLTILASYAALIALTILFVAPLVYMASTAFKTNQEATRIEPTWIPKEPSTEAFDAIVNRSEQTPVFRWFVNSMIAAIGQALIVVATASLAAYALARMEFRGKRLMTAVIISTLFVPPIIFLMPTYLILDKFQWLDSLLAVTIPGAAGALGVFLLRQFFISLPKELEEAAVLDGASPFKIFWRVILPLSKPAASAELAEEVPHIADQQVGCFHGGEVPAAAELGPVHHVVVAFGEGPDGEVIGEHRHRSRYR